MRTNAASALEEGQLLVPRKQSSLWDVNGCLEGTGSLFREELEEINTISSLLVWDSLQGLPLPNLSCPLSVSFTGISNHKARDIVDLLLP